MEVAEGIIDSEESYKYYGLIMKRKNKGCSKCVEFYDKLKKSDEKCVLLELNIGERKSELESLEGKLGFTELENLKLEHEVTVLRQKKEALEKIIRGWEDGDGNLTKLMIENKVLECEKARAEAEISKWKLKCEELEMQVLLMKSGGPSTVQTRDKQKGDKNGSAGTQFEGFKGDHEFELKSSFDFSGKEAPQKNITPSTPGVRHPYAPIVISDTDDDDDSSLYNSNVHKSTSSVGLGVSNSDEKYTRATVVEDNSSDEEKPICYKKRKIQREVAYVVTSESESDSDDNIPICMLRNKKKHKKCTPRRRLKRMSHKSTKIRDDSRALEVMDDLLDEDEMEKDDSGSIGESLGGFIVTSSDDSECDSFSDSDDEMANNESMSSDVAYDEVMSSFGRERKDKKEWEYEADMLADLAKYPELCMKGVCAIYRRQTSEEKTCQATLYINGRGFSQIHASIGSELAEFLTESNPQGDVKKTVKELLEFYPEGVEECRKLAMRYSRQLFEIYKNREDLFFHP